MIIILSILDYFFSFISRYKNRIKNFDNFDSLIFLVKTHLSSLSFFLLFLKILDCWTFPVQCTREEYQENRNEIKTKISITSPWILPWFPSDLYSSLFLRTSNISWYFINDLLLFIRIIYDPLSCSLIVRLQPFARIDISTKPTTEVACNQIFVSFTL